MSKLFIAAAVIAIVVPCMAVGQTWKPHGASQRCHSKWGQPTSAALPTIRRPPIAP